MVAKQYLTDAEHFMTELEMFPALRLSRANTLHISPEGITNFKGFGVAITGASCYNLSIMEEKERRGFIEKIYSKENLFITKTPVPTTEQESAFIALLFFNVFPTYTTP